MGQLRRGVCGGGGDLSSWPPDPSLGAMTWCHVRLAAAGVWAEGAAVFGLDWQRDRLRDAEMDRDGGGGIC